MPTDRPRRRFDGVDAAALVAATALGLVMAREVYGLYTCTWFDEGRHNPQGVRLWRYVMTPLFASWTLALVPLQLRWTRPRRGLVARRPGLVAGLAVACLMIRAVSEQLISHLSHFGLPTRWFGLMGWITAIPSRIVYVADPTGFVVAATWFALGIGRWWRPEPNWVDRAGRALGCSWILLFVVSTYERLAS